MEIIAQLALLAWIPLAAFIFTKYRPAAAGAIVYLGGVMFLPHAVDFDPKGLFPLNKESIPLCSIFFLTAFWSRSTLTRAGISYGEVLILISGIACFFTAFTNTDVQYYGYIKKKALDSSYGISGFVNNTVFFGLPFFMGRALFRRSKDLVLLLSLLVAAGLLYSLFAGVEMRLSPRLHKILYGFHPNHIRFSYRLGGYRPMVFMASGIAVAVFMANTAMASAALFRAKIAIRNMAPKLTFAYLAVVLLFCRSGNGIFYGTMFLPVIAWARMRFQKILLLALALVAFSYPLTRLSDVFPEERLVATANSIHPERGGSLGFRLGMETILMEKARERFLFGWGGHGRNRVYDPIKSRDLSVTDGFWIIALGQRGLIGLYTIYGMMILPIFSMLRNLKHVPLTRDRYLLLTLGFICVCRCIDVLPNGWYTSMPLFFSGALLGLSRGIPEEAAAERRAAARREQKERESAPESVESAAR